MAKKKKKTMRPWCWYCNRDFEDEKVLIQHQKAKHFKCPHCHKKLNTASGMVVHVAQVHKGTITAVPNSIEGRDSVDIEIFGMEGIPEEDIILREENGDVEAASKRLKTNAGVPAPAAVLPGYPPLATAALPTMPFPAALQTMRPPMPFPGYPAYPAAGYPYYPAGNGVMPPPFTMQPTGFWNQPPPSSMQGVPSFPPPVGMPVSYAQPATTTIQPNSTVSTHVPALTSPVQMTAESVHVETPQTKRPDFVLVYNDNSISVEEKRAALEKYKVFGEKTESHELKDPKPVAVA